MRPHPILLAALGLLAFALGSPAQDASAPEAVQKAGAFYAVTCHGADEGYRSGTEEWVRVGSGNAPGLRLGVSTEFAVDGRGKKLGVKLDGMSWEFDLPRALPRSIVWGLGAQGGPDGAATGSAGLWKGLTVQGDPK